VKLSLRNTNITNVRMLGASQCLKCLSGELVFTKYECLIEQLLNCL